MSIPLIVPIISPSGFDRIVISRVSANLGLEIRIGEMIRDFLEELRTVLLSIVSYFKELVFSSLIFFPDIPSTFSPISKA